jgi:hypothetical protein
MVRLNNQGLCVPIKIEDLKYPLIPGTATRIMKKKNMTDMGTKHNEFLSEEDEFNSINKGSTGS